MKRKKVEKSIEFEFDSKMSFMEKYKTELYLRPIVSKMIEKLEKKHKININYAIIYVKSSWRDN